MNYKFKKKEAVDADGNPHFAYGYDIDGEKFLLIDNKDGKSVRSKSYNYVFNKNNGFFARWGVTENDDPLYSPIGPEILDIEVTTKCNGPGGILCPFCYKSNTKNGINMSFDTFRIILDKIGPQLTQIAFGADAQATSNPDLFKMMEYARSKGVVPNITVADISDETANKLALLCGAVAVSAYESNKNICYDSIKKLTTKGMKQINIHVMLSKQTLPFVYEVMKDSKEDERLKGLNAIVLLGLKNKGRANKDKFNIITNSEFSVLVDFCSKKSISLGMDSCSAHKYLNYIDNLPINEKEKNKLKIVVEPCESFGMFSSYINTEGIYFPCSFCEEEGEWKEGIDVKNCNDFLRDVWYNSLVNKYRDIMIKTCRKCPFFEV